MKVAQIGFGHLGKWHAEKAKKVYGDNFIAIVEVNETLHEGIKSIYPDLIVTSRLQEVINDLDAAVIVTPTTYHYEIIEECLRNNLHVFCEKPLTETFEQSLRIQDVLESKKDLVLQAGHSERFHPCWARLKGTLESSRMLKLTRRAPFKGRGADVDIVQDLMIHDFDLLYYFFNETPLSISANGAKIISNNLDYVSALLTFSGNRTAFVTASRVSVDEQRELVAVNQNGELKVDLLNNFFEKSICENGSFKKVEHSYQRADHLLVEHQEFFNSITKSNPPVVGIKDATVVMKMIDLTLKSIKSGVEVSW